MITPRTTPIVSSANDEVIEDWDLDVATGDAVTITHTGVIVRNCRIKHYTGRGIKATDAIDLLIQDVEVINAGAPSGQVPESSAGIINIDMLGCTNVVISRVRLREGSSGIYAQGCAGANFSYIEGYNFKGPFPRGQLVQLNDCDNSTLTQFYNRNDPDNSWPEDNVSAIDSANVTISHGVISGNNSQSGVGVMFENVTGGTCQSVDVELTANGSFSAYPSVDVLFTTCRCFDNIATDQGRGLPLSNALIFAVEPTSTGCGFYTSTYTRPANPGNIAYDDDVMISTDFTEAPDAVINAHIRNVFEWDNRMALGEQGVNNFIFDGTEASAAYYGTNLIWTPDAPPLDGIGVTPTGAFSVSHYLSTTAKNAGLPMYSASEIGGFRRIDRVYNQAVPGNDLHKDVISDRPRIGYAGQHGRRSMFFDGDNDYLEANPLTTGDFIGDTTAYAIISFMPQTITSEEVLIQNNTTLWLDASKNMGVVLKGTIPGNDAPLSYAYGRDLGSFTIRTTTPGLECTNSRPRVAEWRHESSKLWFRLDGEDWVEGDGAFATAFGQEFDFQLGGSGGTTTFFHGHIIDFLTFSGTIPDEGERDHLRNSLLAWVGSDPEWINWYYWQPHELLDIDNNEILWFFQCTLGYPQAVRIHPSLTFIRFFLAPQALCPEVSGDFELNNSRAEINTPAGGFADPPDAELWVYFGHRFDPANPALDGYFGQFHYTPGPGDADASPPISWELIGTDLKIQVRSSTVVPLPGNPAPNTVYHDPDYPLDGSNILWYVHVKFSPTAGELYVWRSDNDGASWTQVVNQPSIGNQYASALGTYFKIGAYTQRSDSPIKVDIAMPQFDRTASDWMNNPIVPVEVPWDA